MITAEDSGPSSVKKPKEDLKALENVPTPTVSIASGAMVLFKL
jgi:transcription factor E2F7/8